MTECNHGRELKALRTDLEAAIARIERMEQQREHDKEDYARVLSNEIEAIRKQMSVDRSRVGSREWVA